MVSSHFENISPIGPFRQVGRWSANDFPPLRCSQLPWSLENHQGQGSGWSLERQILGDHLRNTDIVWLIWLIWLKDPTIFQVRIFEPFLDCSLISWRKQLQPHVVHKYVPSSKKIDVPPPLFQPYGPSTGPPPRCPSTSRKTNSPLRRTRPSSFTQGEEGKEGNGEILTSILFSYRYPCCYFLLLFWTSFCQIFHYLWEVANNSPNCFW